LADRGGEHARGVLGRALFGVTDLGAGDLEDERADVVALRGAEERTRRVVRQRADVERRDGEPARHLAAPDGHVQRVNRRRDRAARPRLEVDRAPRAGLRFAVAEDSFVGDLVDVEVWHEGDFSAEVSGLPGCRVAWEPGNLETRQPTS